MEAIVITLGVVTLVALLCRTKIALEKLKIREREHRLLLRSESPDLSSSSEIPMLLEEFEKDLQSTGLGKQARLDAAKAAWRMFMR